MENQRIREIVNLNTVNLNGLRDIIKVNNTQRGFYDNNIEVGTCLMLVTSELSEALEADRKGIVANTNGFDNDMHNAGILPTFDDLSDRIENKNVAIEFKRSFEATIKNSFEDEIADAIIRLLDICGRYDIDIEKHIDLKMAYNTLRPFKHGKAY